MGVLGLNGMEVKATGAARSLAVSKMELLIPPAGILDLCLLYLHDDSPLFMP